MRIKLIRALGLEEPLLRMVRSLDAAIRRWPWLYRRLGGKD